jgi:hydrogenase/urease accessory protein HupE
VLGPALHILTEPDHLVACLAIGLLAGQRLGGREIAGLLNAFITAFVLAFCAAALTRLAAFEAIDAFASACTLMGAGLLVAIPRISRFGIAIFVAVATGAIHGFANGLAATSLLTVFGAGGAAALIAVFGAMLAWLLRAPWGVIAVRVLGSWTAAMGLILFGIALR